MVVERSVGGVEVDGVSLRGIENDEGSEEGDEGDKGSGGGGRLVGGVEVEERSGWWVGVRVGERTGGGVEVGGRFAARLRGDMGGGVCLVKNKFLDALMIGHGTAILGRPRDAYKSFMVFTNKYGFSKPLLSSEQICADA